MFLPPSEGGIGVLHIESKMAAIQCLHIGDMISNKEAKWIPLAVYWCGHSIRSAAPALPRRNAPNSFQRPKFYQQVMGNFREHRDHVGGLGKAKIKNRFAQWLSSVQLWLPPSTLFVSINLVPFLKPSVELEHTQNGCRLEWSLLHPRLADVFLITSYKYRVHCV